MLILPGEIMTLFRAFASVFSERVFERVKVLVVGAILSPHKRTVSAALRVMGLSNEVQFQNYHRLLSRAKWNSLEVSKKTDQAQGRRHKTSIDWIRQMINLVRRWLPKHDRVLVV